MQLSRDCQIELTLGGCADLILVDNQIHKEFGCNTLLLLSVLYL
jgi:hypothetical protein